jgi:hypothetical protein
LQSVFTLPPPAPTIYDQMNDEYSRLKEEYRQARCSEFLWAERPEGQRDLLPMASAKRKRLEQELVDFCAASGIDREDIQQFIAEIDQEHSGQISM